jgi:predicted transcriptional regulator
MAEAIQFTEQEVQSINQLRQEVANVFSQLGQLAIERERRLKELDDLQEQMIGRHRELQEREQNIFKSLNEKYGDGNYDPETNTFIPTPKEEDTQE